MPARHGTSRWSPVLAALGAEAGAIAGAVLGFVLGAVLSMASGVQRYELGNEPEGFDTMDAALLGGVLLWVVGALLGARFATLRRPQPVGLASAGAVVALVVLAAGATVVGSAAADWYFPGVFFVAPPLAMAIAAFRTSY